MEDSPERDGRRTITPQGRVVWGQLLTIEGLVKDGALSGWEGINLLYFSGIELTFHLRVFQLRI